MFLLGFSFLGVWEVNKRSGGSKQRDPYPAKEEEFGPLKMSKIEKRGRTEEGGGSQMRVHHRVLPSSMQL